MKIKEISFSRGASLNMGNYNSAKVDVWAKVEVEEGEDPEAAYAALREWIHRKTREEAAAIKGGKV